MDLGVQFFHFESVQFCDECQTTVIILIACVKTKYWTFMIDKI